MFITLCLTACITTPAAPFDDDDVEKAAAALIEVFRHPEARGERLEHSRRAIAALTAFGKPAVPKLLDAILAKDDPATAYSGLALKEMVAAQSAAGIKARWDKVGTAGKWKLVPFHKRFEFEEVSAFALKCLESKDVFDREPAWGFVIQNARSMALAPAKEKYLKALAGGETPSLLWGLLVQDFVFDAEKEADILVALLKPDSWVAEGLERGVLEGRPPPEWPDGRDIVVEILHHRKVKRAAPALVKLLAEKGEGKAFFGHIVIPTLGDLGDKDAVPELKRVLATKPEDLRPSLTSASHTKALTARALWQLGDQTGRPLIVELLKAKGWGDRRFAAETVARVGTKDDIPLLASVLDDTDWGVLQAASEGLERITGVKNRPNGNTRATESDAPLWKEWLKKNK